MKNEKLYLAVDSVELKLSPAPETTVEEPKVDVNLKHRNHRKINIFLRLSPQTQVVLLSINCCIADVESVACLRFLCCKSTKIFI